MAPKRKAKSRSKAKKGSGKPVAKKKKQKSRMNSAKRKKASVVQRESSRPEEAERALAAAAAAATVEADAAGLADVVPIPPANTFNEGLHSASEATMLSLLGVPGNKTRDCSSPTGQFARRIKFNVDVVHFG
jgi:hypothetical protein